MKQFIAGLIVATVGMTLLISLQEVIQQITQYIKLIIYVRTPNIIDEEEPLQQTNAIGFNFHNQEDEELNDT